VPGATPPRPYQRQGAMSHTGTAGLPVPGPYWPGHTQEGKGAPAAADARFQGNKQPRFGLAGVLAWGFALMCGDGCRGIVSSRAPQRPSGAQRPHPGHTGVSDVQITHPAGGTEPPPADAAGPIGRRGAAAVVAACSSSGTPSGSPSSSPAGGSSAHGAVAADSLKTAKIGRATRRRNSAREVAKCLCLSSPH
jgi:hypothetical protein